MTLAKRQLLSIFLLLCPLACFASGQNPSLDQQYETAQRALTMGNYPEAQQLFEQLERANPEVAEIHANLGLIYFEERKFEQAIPELRRALKLKPTLTHSATILALSLSELGQYREALPVLERGFRSNDQETRRMCGLQLERAYTVLMVHDKAIDVALEMNRQFPRDPEVLYHDGKIFGNFAFMLMQKLSQLAPDSVWTHQAAAEAYESEGSFSSAIGEYRQVLKIEPHRVGVHYRLGRTLLAQWRKNGAAADLGAAAKEFEEELVVDPPNANAAYELAQIHRDAGEFKDAQRYFELALDNHPDFEEAHLGLAAVLTSLQRPDLAIPHLQKAISLNSKNEVPWYRLAQAERALGNKSEQEKALAEFRRLHDRANQQQEMEPLFSPQDVTKQEIDPTSAQ